MIPDVFGMSVPPKTSSLGWIFIPEKKAHKTLAHKTLSGHPGSRSGTRAKRSVFFWEVLNGVGVDGVRGTFPHFFVSFHFSSFFFVFLRFYLRFYLRFFLCFFLFVFLFVFLRFSVILLEDTGKQLQFTAKMGNFTSPPSAPSPFKTSQFLGFRR